MTSTVSSTLFVELGGFLFTFIGDGAPGTGKTTLIQMIAGLVNDYAQVAGVPFHYENFGVDQISSYQGKSGQNCRQFINTVMNPRVIGFGTIDDVDQVAAKRSDDRASAGQHEITGVLMDAFSGAGTVIRGNCSFGMFSNYPENVDDALRQRAGARWLVDGPQTREDYIDIFVLLAARTTRYRWASTTSMPRRRSSALSRLLTSSTRSRREEAAKGLRPLHGRARRAEDAG